MRQRFLGAVCAVSLGFCLAVHGAPFMRGDVNDDGVVDISDAVAALAYLFAHEPHTCLDAIDVNDDGRVDIADAIYLLAYLFTAGEAPPAPFRVCGTDPTDDGLPECAPRRQCAPPATPTTGEQRVLVLVVDNGISPSGFTPAQARAITDQVALFYEEMSYGRAWLEVELAGVFHIPDAAGTASPQVFQAAVDAGVDFRGFQHVITGYLTGGGGGSLGPGIRRVIGSGAEAYEIVASFGYFNGMASPSSWRVMAHELGHGFGLGHARTLSSLTGHFINYGSLVDIMGSGSGHFGLDFKDALGWISPVEIATVRADGAYVIRPLSDQAPGLRGLRIPLSERVLSLQAPGISPPLVYEGEPWLYAETRRPIGFDAGILNPLGLQGAHLRLIPPNNAWEPSTEKLSSYSLDATPETPFNSSMDFGLLPGRTWSDRLTGLHLTVTDETELWTMLEVRFDDGATNRPPSILDVRARELDADGTVEFEVDAGDPDGDDLAVFWSLAPDVVRDEARHSPGSFAQGRRIVHRFPRQTPRRVHVIVSDRRGGEAWGWADIFGHEQPPFTPGPIQASAQGPQRFSFAVGGPPILFGTYRWDFGDGAVSTLPTPLHVYAEPGIYMASVAVSNREHEVILTLEVDATQADNIPPVADAGPDLTVRLGELGTLDGSGSHDPDGYPVSLRFFWTAPREIDLQTPNARITRFTATAVGEYEVQLSVFDGALWATDTARVTVVP